jgi:tight adherence protein B
MRRWARIALLVGLAVLALAAPAQAAGGARLAEAAGSRFPDRSYVLTLPSDRALTAAEVSVRENGRPIRRVSVTPADGAAAYRFGVVLVIDTSSSMRGRPLRAAVAAARAFVRHRKTSQPVALMTFAGDVQVVQPFTTDATAIERGLAGIAQGGGGSRMLDATTRAIQLIEAAHIRAGSVVVLSDGADRRSHATTDRAAAAARRAGARVFTIGLRSDSRDFGALNLLAADTHGEFSSAGSIADLARIYDRLGSRLAHQYLLQYRSAAGPGTQVRVGVSVTGLAGTARAAYRTPEITTTTRVPFRRTAGERFWTSPAAAAVVSLATAALLMLALSVLLRPGRRSLADRMADYVSAAPGEEAEGRTGARPALLKDRVLLGAERSLEGRPWWAAFTEKLEIGRIMVPPVRLLAATAVGTVTVLALLPAIGGSPAFGMLAFAVPLGVWLFVQRRVATQRRIFGEQLPDNLQVIASAMRAGHSFAGALAVVVNDAPEPTRRELQRVVTDERLGVPLESALREVVRRMDSKDLEQVALVAALQRETGGNTAEVLDRVTETVRERLELRRTVKTLTAQGRMSRWVLSLLPVALLGLFTVISPAYMAPLFGSPTGRLLLAGGGVMVVAGSLVIKRIVDIKV